MGSVFSGKTTIGGVVSAPGIPFALSPLSGLFASLDMFGLSLNGVDSFDINASVLNIGANTKATGALSFNSSIATGPTPKSITASINNNFIYVANSAATTFSGYSINKTTGVLTALAGSPYANGGAVNSSQVVAHPNGNLLYVVQGVGDISIFKLDTATGIPTANGSVGIATASFLLFSASGNFAYVLSSNAALIRAYSVNQTTGAFTFISQIATGNNPLWCADSPNGNFLYVNNNNDSTISAYTVNQSTGSLTAIAGSPFATGNAFTGMRVSPNGAFLYSASGTGIYVYTINQITGVIAQIVGSPYLIPNTVVSLTIDSTGDNLYATTNADSSMHSFTLNKLTGAMSPAAGNTFAIAGAPGFMALLSDNIHMFVTLINTNLCESLTTNGQASALSGVPLVQGVFDPALGFNGTLNINGSLTVKGLPVPFNGSSPIYASVSLYNGVPASPSLFFSSDTTTGFYSSAAGFLNAAISGVQAASLSANGWGTKSNSTFSTGRAVNTTAAVAAYTAPASVASNYIATPAAAITVTLAAPTADGERRRIVFGAATTVTWTPTAPATAVAAKTIFAAGESIELVYNSVAGTPANSAATTWYTY